MPCKHDWFVVSMGSRDDCIIVHCPKCGALARVGDVTPDDLTIVMQAWQLGIVLIWGDESRLVLAGELAVHLGPGVELEDFGQWLERAAAGDGFLIVSEEPPSEEPANVGQTSLDAMPPADELAASLVAELVAELDLQWGDEDDYDIPF